MDTIPPVLLERFSLYDDNKNNNRDQASLSKEYVQSIKSTTHENDSNLTKNITTYGNNRNIQINFKFDFLFDRISC